MKDLNCSGIYQIKNLVNGKVYVGSAVNMYKRWHTSHIVNLRKNSHQNRHLQRSFNKHGEENFKFEVLQFVPDKKKLLIMEQKYLNKFNKNQLYNIRLIAKSNLGLKFSKEAKQRMSRAVTGRKHTQDTKNKMSNSAKGKPVSKKTRDKISKTLTGKKHTEETRQKMSIATKGFKHTKETKHKISIALIGKQKHWQGRKHLEETKNKIAIAHKKSIAQIDPKNNNVFKIWSSMTEIEEFFELWAGEVSKAVRKQIKIKGFIWKKVDKKTGEIIEPTC